MQWNGDLMFSPLAFPTYRHLFAAQLLSLLGTGLATVALGLLAYDLAGADAGAVLGTAFAIKMIAYVGIAPVAGAFVHLVPRRALLVVLDVLRAGVAMALPSPASHTTSATPSFSPKRPFSSTRRQS